MKCKTCEGKGFTELEHGLVMLECPDCKGTGEIDASDNGTGQADKPKTKARKRKRVRKNA